MIGTNLCSEEKTKKKRVIFNRQRYQPKQMPKAPGTNLPSPYPILTSGKVTDMAKIVVSHLHLFLFPERQGSHEKKPPTFHYTGWLIGILTMVYYNPYITG